METDLELYRREALVIVQPPLRLSLIDIAPDHPQHCLVFLHGFGGRATQWLYQLNHFSNDNRVIALDLRGHGRSDKPRTGYGMAQLLTDLLNSLDALGINQPVVLVGHSFGCALAAEFAAAHPIRVKRLILIAATGEFKLNRIYRLLLKLPANVLQALTPFTHNWLGAPPQVLKAWYMNSLSQWNGWSLFRSLNIPTLVIRGHQDAVFEQVMYEEVARTIPYSEEIDVGASGHMVMLERREAVNRAIGRFLDTDKRAFSQSRTGIDETERDKLIQERPWLTQYDQDVPFTVAVPPVLLPHLLQSAARRFPTRKAILFEGSSITYRRLERESNRLANALLSLGVTKGERVMIVLPNMPQMVISFFGILKASAVAVFALPTTSPEELIRQLQDSGSSVLITLSQSQSLIKEIKSSLENGEISSLRHIILTNIADYLPAIKRLTIRLARKSSALTDLKKVTPLKFYLFLKLLDTNNEESPYIEQSNFELAVIQYTGGTIASPKGVMLSHRNLVANALQTRHWIPEAKEGKEIFLSVLPFSHSYGLTAALNVPVALAATMILKPKYETADILRTIQKYHPTIFPGVPQMYVAISDYPGVRKYGIATIRACISGSAPLAVEVQEAFEKLTHGRLVEGYGLTEASPVTHANPLNGLRKVGSIGIPLPSTEARLVDLRTGKKTVPSGQIGELAVRGPQVMIGYWNDPEATRRVVNTEGWLLTGDVAQMDQEGYYRIIARKADMWYPKKPGKPAFPRDLEEVLFEIPQVKEAAVVAIASQPIAFIIPRREPPTPEAVISYCKRRLPPELVPRLVIFVEDFPRTFIGKVLRRELAQKFRESSHQLL